MKSVLPLILSVLIAAIGSVVGLGGCAGDNGTPPEVTVRPVVNIYHDVKVTDNYQWLENGNRPETQAFDSAQNQYSRSILDRLPCRDIIEKRLRTLYEESSASYSSLQWVYLGGLLFAEKMQPPNDQAILVTRTNPDDPETERVVVDPNKIDTSGHTSIAFYVPSHDGQYVAVALSEGGTEDGNVYVYRTADGLKLSDFVPLVNGPTAGGDVAWAADKSGFFYTHYPRPGERPEDELRFYQQVYWHQLGTPTEDDTLVIGKDFPAIAEIEFETSADGSRILAVVSNGDGGEYAHYLRGKSGKWTQVTQFDQWISTAVFGPDNSLYLLQTKDTPRGQILRLAPSVSSLAKAEVVVEEGDAVITGLLATGNYLFVNEMIGGPGQLRQLDLDGSFARQVPIRPVSSVSNLISVGGDKILFRNSSYLEPSACYIYDAAEGTTVKTALANESVADFGDVEAVRKLAVSKDGTQVPMTILHRKGAALNGDTPTILYGYGGYGSSQQPRFDETLSMWLAAGGVYAVANIRGGGEFGQEWHLQGNLTKKQNVFDDFTACAQYLIDSGYTSPKRLAIRGGSNGGLLVGATMTQHPELFKAVVCQKGVLDMLRVELHPNGVFNVTEFGTVTDPDQFQALLAYSPYHNVTDSVAYPATLFTADINDGRVDASDSRKMAAALQAATSGSGPILLRMSSGGGHGFGMAKSDRISQDADVWSFLFDQLGAACDSI